MEVFLREKVGSVKYLTNIHFGDFFGLEIFVAAKELGVDSFLRVKSE